MWKVIRKFFADWVWQLPQNIIGVLYKGCIITSSNISNDEDYKVYYKYSNGSVSLGKFIFVSIKSSNISRTTKHEVGHYKQSCLLGPFYLLIIGIPSITWATLRMIFPLLRKYSYYELYTEKWANKLGGLE